MTFRLDQPLWMAVWLLAVPLAVVAMICFRAMSRVRRWSAIAARITLFGLLAAMLAGLSSVRSSERLAVIAVVDISGSVQRFFDPGVLQVDGVDGRPPGPLDAIAAFLREAGASRGPEDLLGLVVFDDRPVALQAPTTVDLFETLPTSAAGEGTDLERAVAMARTMIPPGVNGRIVIISDGVSTSGNPAQAAALTNPFPIDVVPLAYSVRGEVIVESVDAPAFIPGGLGTGERINVRVVLSTTGPASGRISLLREGEVVDLDPAVDQTSRRVQFPSAGTFVEVLNVELPEGRLHRFEAAFEPDTGEDASGVDTVAANNRGEAFTVSPGRGSVLLIDGSASGQSAGRADPAAGPLAETLRGAGFEVSVLAPESVPADLLWLQSFDLVILQDASADAVRPETQRALSAFVSELAGGLVMIGGPGSFGAGGWKGSPIEPLLPVVLDLPDKLVTPAAAVVLVLDNSGSMARPVMGSSRSQQEIANEGAARAVEALDPKDLLSIIVFNSETRVLRTIAPNSDAARTAAEVRRIAPDGGTNLVPALRAARAQLAGVQADLKHIIVMSDGRSQDAEQIPAVMAEIAADGIRASSIAVGDGVDAESMAQISDIAGGKFYRVADPSILPRIFLKAVSVVRQPLIRERPFAPVVLPTGSPLVEGLSGDIPPLRGLVLTQARRDPTIINAMATPTGEPLLAEGPAGLGRVVAFTSDAHGNWARDWLSWPGYGRLWKQIARRTARPPTDRRQQLAIELHADRMLVRLDAADPEGGPLDGLTVPGAVYAPGGARIPINLMQTGAGVYEATVPAPTTGTYIAVLNPRTAETTLTGGQAALPPVIGGVSRSSGAEFRRLRSNIETLRKLAESTGGRLLQLVDADGRLLGGNANLFDRTGVVPALSRQPLWRLLLPLAIVVFLLDAATRRIAWDRFISREFGASLRREAAAALAERSERAAVTSERLRGRRGRPAVTAPAAAGRAVDTQAAATLSDSDAIEIIKQQRRLREQRRDAERVLQPRHPGNSSITPPAADSSASADPPDLSADQSVTGAASLMDAKRRARSRIDGFHDRSE